MVATVSASLSSASAAAAERAEVGQRAEVPQLVGVADQGQFDRPSSAMSRATTPISRSDGSSTIAPGCPFTVTSRSERPPRRVVQSASPPAGCGRPAPGP